MQRAVAFERNDELQNRRKTHSVISAIWQNFFMIFLCTGCVYLERENGKNFFKLWKGYRVMCKSFELVWITMLTSLEKILKQKIFLYEEYKFIFVIPTQG
jgi:late competence protein required for DNA uptake (superfamily II DNA/RNA helicase)